MKKCHCCKEEFEINCSEGDYAWKLDGKFYCSYHCYSKEFDKKYKASNIGRGYDPNTTYTKDVISRMEY